MAAIQITYDNL